MTADIMSVRDAFNVVNMIRYAEANFDLRVKRGYGLEYTASSGQTIYTGTHNGKRYVTTEYIWTKHYYDCMSYTYDEKYGSFAFMFYTYSEGKHVLTSEFEIEVVNEDREKDCYWLEDGWDMICSDMPC